MTWTPKLPPPKPPIARQHCRWYDYKLGSGGGPACEAGIDNTQPRGSMPCMPEPTVSCPRRREWTAEERASWAAWQAEHMERLVVIMTAIPDDGFQGRMTCPGCGTGTVSWSRAPGNRHLHAGCSTPNCFRIMQ